MQKIMFNDRYGLTKAVLEGRKTMTRRAVPERVLDEYYDYDDYCFAVAPSGIPCSRDYEKEFFLRRSQYKVGEVVAVAQSYSDASLNWINMLKYKGEPGWKNKMFVRADLMPHKIRIKNIRVERLRDITRGDIEKEGIQWSHKAHRYYTCFNPITATYLWLKGSTPEEAFATLIDKVSGKGIWNRNPWVFVYEFELVK